MKIFFSYGHDDNVPLVLRIQEDLEKRGHQIWIDRFDIKGGEDWRRKITEDLLACDMVLSFASRYSVRTPGVCLDELSIAISVRSSLIQAVLLEPVLVPAAIRRRNFFDFCGWKEYGMPGDPAFEAWYQPLFEQMAAYLESEPVLKYRQEIDRVLEVMHPDLSGMKKNQLLRQSYLARPWLLDEVHHWLDRDARRLMVITGGPGTGKSSFIAHKHLDFSSSLCVLFCDWASQAHNTLPSLICSLAFQIAQVQEDYRSELLRLLEGPNNPMQTARDPHALFFELILRPLSLLIDGQRDTMLIVLDGLDEMQKDPDGSNPLLKLLMQSMDHFPQWVRFLITSRPDLLLSGGFKNALTIALDQEARAKEDVSRLLGRRLHLTCHAPDIHKAADLCQDNFLFAKILCDELIAGTITLDEFSEIPALSDLYSRFFLRTMQEAGFSQKHGAYLAALAISPEPMPKETWLNLGKKSREILNVYAPYLIMENGTVRLFHQSFCDWLLDEDNEFAGQQAARGWKKISKALLKAASKGYPSMNRYEKIYLLTALKNAKRPELTEILHDESLGSEMLKEATLLQQTHQDQDAYVLYKTAFEIFKALGMPEKILRCADACCTLAYQLVKANEVLPFCLGGISAAKQLGAREDWIITGKLCRTGAYSIFRSGLYKQADYIYEQAVFFFEQADDPAEVIETLRAKGENGRFINIKTHAIPCFDKAFALFDRQFTPDQKPGLYVHLLQTAGRAYLEMHEWGIASKMLKQAYKLACAYPHDLNDHEWCNLEYGLGMLYYRQRDEQKAIELLQSALRHEARFAGEYTINQCDCLHRLGLCFRNLGKIQKAVLYLQKGYDIRQKAYGKKNLLTSIIYGDLISCSAKLYKQMDEKQKQQFVTLYEELIDIRKSLTGQKGLDLLAHAHLDYSRFLLETEDFYEAAIQQREALILYERLKDARMMVRCHLLTAEIYQKQFRLAECSTEVSKAREILHEHYEECYLMQQEFAPFEPDQKEDRKHAPESGQPAAAPFSLIR